MNHPSYLPWTAALAGLNLSRLRAWKTLRGSVQGRAVRRNALLFGGLLGAILFFVAACGGAGAPTAPPPPPGGYTLKVAVGPHYSGGGVMIEPSPGGNDRYPSGTVVKLTAGPSVRHKCLDTPYWSFTGWSGDVQGSTRTVEIIMDSDKRVTAGFSEFFPPPCETPPPPPDCQEPTLDISVNGDALEFDKGRFEVAAGSEVVLCFNNVSSINQHNWVLVNDGTKDEVARRGTEHPENGWLQPGDPDVIAYVRILSPGERGEVHFTSPPTGTYQFVCTFPGHNFTMFGDFVVAP